jgi:mannose-6-phosphate isomerase-like protein (cupin superfamily)
MTQPEQSMKACIKANDETQEYFFVEGCFITELSNSPADPEVSVVRARVEPGKTTRWHYLRGTSERYVVLQGVGSVEVDQMPPHRVSTGDVVIIPPQSRQRISNTGEADLVFLAICSPRFTEDAYVDDEH